MTPTEGLLSDGQFGRGQAEVHPCPAERTKALSRRSCAHGEQVVVACQRGGRADDVVGFCCEADGSIRRTPPFS